VLTSNPVPRFLLVSKLEGCSFLLLLICSVLKRTTDFNAVPVMGVVHAVLFLGLLALIVEMKLKLNWDGKTTGLAALAAVLPFGPFVFDAKMKDKMRPQGVQETQTA
jgi:integral membrane protein